jgi:hypothetical protein
MSNQTPTQLDASDLPWIDTRNLAGVLQATADERATIGAVLSGLHIRDDFGARPFLIHDGDLHVRGHLASSVALLVRGDLRIDGIYHDDLRGPYGILAVLGDMRARDVLNGASLYVRGDLHVSGVMLATNTDMALQIEGQLHAEGMVVWDKGVQYRRSERVSVPSTPSTCRADLGRGPIASRGCPVQAVSRAHQFGAADSR